MRRFRLTPYLFPAVLLLAGIALRLWYVLRCAIIQTDSTLYAEIADNWVRFHVYGLSTAHLPQPTIIRLPGYPLFLLASGLLFGHWIDPDSFGSVFLLQGILDLAGCYLLARTASNLARRVTDADFARKVFLLTLAIACLCPFTATYVATPLTESPTLFTIAVCLYAFERWEDRFRSTNSGINRYVPLLAAALAYSALLRPDQVLMGFAFLPMMLWVGMDAAAAAPSLRSPAISTGLQEIVLQQKIDAQPRWRAAWTPAVVALLLTVVPFVPWAIRNWRTFHVFQPLAPRYANEIGEPVNYGFQRWYRTWAIDFSSTEEFYWKYPDESIDIGNLPDRAFDSDEEYDRTDQLIADANDQLHYDASIDRRFNELAETRIHADPLRYYVLMPAGRLLNMLFHPRTEMLPYELRWWQYGQNPSQAVASWILALLNLGYYTAAVFGARRCWKTSRFLTTACIAYIALRCLLLLTLDNSEQRYTLELYPILLLWIGMLAMPRKTNTIGTTLASNSSPSRTVAG